MSLQNVCDCLQAGTVAIPLFGAYCASKFGLEVRGRAAADVCDCLNSHLQHEWREQQQQGRFNSFAGVLGTLRPQFTTR